MWRKFYKTTYNTTNFFGFGLRYLLSSSIICHIHILGYIDQLSRLSLRHYLFVWCCSRDRKTSFRETFVCRYLIKKFPLLLPCEGLSQRIMLSDMCKHFTLEALPAVTLLIFLNSGMALGSLVSDRALGPVSRDGTYNLQNQRYNRRAKITKCVKVTLAVILLAILQMEKLYIYIFHLICMVSNCNVWMCLCFLLHYRNWRKLKIIHTWTQHGRILAV